MTVSKSMALAAVLLCTHAFSGAAQASSPAAPMITEKTAAWLAAATPGPAHQVLDRFVGDWDTTTRVWFGGISRNPIEGRGTAHVTWILGRRFIREEASAAFFLAGEDGRLQALPYEGVGITGYDNFRRLYVGSWVDTFGTAILTATGQADPEGRRFTFFSEVDDPVSKEIGGKVKTVIRIVDDDSHVFEMYELAEGRWMLVMEIVYSRSTDHNDGAK